VLFLVENFVFRFKISSDRLTVLCLVKDENFLEPFLSSKDTLCQIFDFSFICKWSILQLRMQTWLKSDLVLIQPFLLYHVNHLSCSYTN